MLSRRSFSSAIAASLAGGIGRATARTAAATTIVDVADEPTGQTVSPSIVSLSYETTALRDPSFFAASNTALVDLFRQLNPNGVLRLGGNTSDWSSLENFDLPLPVLHPLYRHREQVLIYYPITTRALDALAGFLDATGWKVIFGIDLRARSTELVTRTAALVRDRLGSRLLAIQVGNEANNYFKTYDAYFAAWQKAVSGTPHGDLGGPDTGADTDWVLSFGRDVPEAVLLSRHYYREAADKGSIADMLQHDTGFDRELAQMSLAAASHRLGFWLTEANSYYLGGAPGVSDTFASALWGLDFTLSSAANGVRGICYHGGPKNDVATSLGPLEHSAADESRKMQRVADASAVYSPIGGDLHTGFAPRPIYYGLVAARHLAGFRLYDRDPAGASPGIRIYSGRQGAMTRLVALNLSRKPHRLALRGLPQHVPVRTAALAAPDLLSQDTMQLGTQKANFLPGGTWSLAMADASQAAGRGWSAELPPGSALLISA